MFGIMNVVITIFSNKASEINWDTLQNDDINLYANNLLLHNADIEIANECIPNKEIKVKASETPWITSLKRHIQKNKPRYPVPSVSGEILNSSETQWCILFVKLSNRFMINLQINYLLEYSLLKIGRQH